MRWNLPRGHQTTRITLHCTLATTRRAATRSICAGERPNRTLPISFCGRGGFRGENSPVATVTDMIVATIYRMRLDGYTIREIAAELVLPYTTVENIYVGSAWTHRLGVDGNPTLEELRMKRPKKTRRVSQNRKLTDQQVDYIFQSRMAGKKCREIAAELQMPLGTISPVFTGNAFSDRLGVNGNPTKEELQSVRAPSNSVKLTDDDKAEIRALVAQGYVKRDIAKQYGVSPATITLVAPG